LVVKSLPKKMQFQLNNNAD